MDETERDLPIMAFADQPAFEAWLADQPAGAKGIWMKFAKGASGIASVSKAQAIETALCYGWIDGQIDSFDADWFLTRFTPRSARSKWSAINKAKAIQLIADGRMRPAGLAQIERAKADGRWDAAYASQATIEVPADLQAALDAQPAAKALFAELDSANRYAVLYRVQEPKKAETRAGRIETLVAMLARGETVHPRRAKGK